MDSVNLKFNGNMSFTAKLNNHTIELDGPVENGGNDNGVRPKMLLLVSLAGCTGMDIASLARKMRVEIKNLDIQVKSTKAEDIMPIVYTSATVVYNFEASDDDAEKIVKMVTMSQERYCGVSAMLRHAFSIDYEIYLNNKKI